VKGARDGLQVMRVLQDARQQEQAGELTGGLDPALLLHLGGEAK